MNRKAITQIRNGDLHMPREIIVASESRYPPEISCVEDITTVMRASAIPKILVIGCETAVMRDRRKNDLGRVCSELTNSKNHTSPRPSQIESKAEHWPVSPLRSDFRMSPSRPHIASD
jgi:hypothetical protein